MFEGNGAFSEVSKFFFASLPLGGREYLISVDIVCEGEHFYGKENECRIVERFAKYTVHGVGQGAGIVEWQYRNVQGLK